MAKNAVPGSAGEIASALAVETIHRHINAASQNLALSLIGPSDPALSPSGNRLASAIREANQAIYREAKQRPEWAGMGTTVVAVLLTEQGMSFAHVGDSRLYLIHAGTIRQLTADHSWVAEQVRSGLMTEAEAERSPQRNMVTRAVGVAPTVNVTTDEIGLQPGDLLLLCSDGLTKGVGAGTLLATLTHTDDMTAATRQLVILANRAGGEDNITVITLAIHDAMEQPMRSSVRQPVAI